MSKAWYSDNKHNKWQSCYNYLQTCSVKNRNGHVKNSSLELCSGFHPVNPLHKISSLLKDEFIINPTTLGGYRMLIKIRRFCRDHYIDDTYIAVNDALESTTRKSAFVNEVESSASVGIFREHLQNSNPKAFYQLRRI